MLVPRKKKNHKKLKTKLGRVHVLEGLALSGALKLDSGIYQVVLDL